ncbi:MAG: hypothetical protein IKU54_01125 [Oscillospiraceae bacterium]|nr:hypothetical protein [Oscillospiraceae bacterium]
MKKLLLIVTAVTIIAGFSLTLKYDDQYTETHLPPDTVVYYAPGDAIVHITPQCSNLHLNGQSLEKSTWGKAQLGYYADGLCAECVPKKYLN